MSRFVPLHTCVAEWKPDLTVHVDENHRSQHRESCSGSSMSLLLPSSPSHLLFCLLLYPFSFLFIYYVRQNL
jgi:hypothetical protein